jgi:hypothetical protein
MKLKEKKVFKGKCYNDYKDKLNLYLDSIKDNCIFTEYFYGKDIEGIKVEVYEL